MSQQRTGQKINKDSDDWDTDPDYIRDMDEISQRWGGTKRTIGSINMNELIDDVRREHTAMRDKFQINRLGDFVVPQINRSIGNDDEIVSKSNEIRREIITSESSSYIKESNGSVIKETFHETKSPTSSTRTTSRHKSPVPPKPENLTSRVVTGRVSSVPKRPDFGDTIIVTDPPRQFDKYSSSKKIFEENTSATLPAYSSPEAPVGKTTAFKSIQDKIDAFKREFDNIEHNVSKKSDISKVIKKMSTNVEQKGDNVQYVSRSNEKISSSDSRTASPMQSSLGTDRPSSASSLRADTQPKTRIKSLSERFETLGRESSDDFKQRMEERRKEFFDRIKTQVRETRKGLDGFDIDDSDDEDRFRSSSAKQSASPLFGSQSTGMSSTSFGSSRPKIYTKRETTQEEVVSRIVKENDKIVHDETKRNVEHTSSCHGSSDEEANNPEPSSIKFIEKELRSSPQQRTQSPIDEIKRKVPVVNPEVKGAGLMARTLYDYQAAERDELTFDVDDLITNIEKIDQGWYKGTITKNGAKQVGLFPANYVKLLNDSGEY